MTAKNNSIVFILLVALLCAVYYWYDNNKKNKEVPCGGPCSYSTTVYPIIIANINTYADSSYNMDCNYTLDQRFDSNFNYYMTNNSYISKQKLGVWKVGDTICLLEQIITSGSCTPHILSIELKKFVGEIPVENNINDDNQ